MIPILIVGIILLIGGVLFLISPATVIKINNIGQRFVFGEGNVVKHNIQTGILLLVTGALMLLMYVKWGN